RNRINWHYVRDDVLFSTIKVVSRHHTTQQYGAILPIELTTDEIRNSKAYKEYYACVMGEAAPKPKASARKKKGESASSTTPPTPTPTTTVESAPRLSATTKGKQPSRATTPTEPIDVQTTEEELLWNSSDDEDVGGHEEGNKSDESDDERNERSENDSDKTVEAGVCKYDDDNDDEDNDDNDEEEELAKSDEEDEETGKGGDEVRESEGESNEEETRQEEEESFDPIPRTPKEKEEEDELYHDVNINQGRGLQVTQNVEDTHVTLTPVNPDGPQESSSMSSFVSSMLNPISDVGVESIFTTASSPIVSLQTPTPIMTPSTISTITTSSEAPIPPPTIPSMILDNLPMFNSAFRFEERLRLLETSFSKYRQTNSFADAVSTIP
nr:hypothetical protein [Tanacetum cinerariifolium]